MVSTAQSSSPSSAASTPSDNLYAIHFPLTHPTFRFPVLRSVAKEYSIPLRFYPLPPDDVASSLSYQDLIDSYVQHYDPEVDAGRPFAIVSLPSDKEAALLLQKCTVVKAITHLWAAATSAEGLISALRQPSSQSIYAPLQSEDLSWKADVSVMGVKVSQGEKNLLINRLSFLAFRGPVNLRCPDFEWAWWEERWGISGAAITQQHHDMTKNDQPRLVLVGRRIVLPGGISPAREWIERLDLKKRKYIGNTSMEAEMSLLLAHMALSSANAKIIYDPFVGTGSLLIACAAMGAYVFGSDIDGRMMRGKETAKGGGSRETGILKAARQYGLQDHFLDCLTFDITQHPWRVAKEQTFSSSSCGPSCSSNASITPRNHQGFLDAIVADPPYGVRAGAKRLGHRDVHRQRSEPVWLEDRKGWSHEQDDYIPPTRPYALHDLLKDLLAFAAILVKDGGRLVFWMPVMNEEADDERRDDDEGKEEVSVEKTTTSLPDTGDDWELVAVSTQDFGKWARRLVTMERQPRIPQGCRCTCQHLGKDASTKLHTSSSSSSSSPSSSSLPQDPSSSSSRTSTSFPPNRAISDRHTQFHQQSGRYRANVDPSDFRNQFFKSSKGAGAGAVD